jgi:hypothetical protein
VKTVRFTVRTYYNFYGLGCEAVYCSINVQSFLRNLLLVLRAEDGAQLFVAIIVQEASSLNLW